MLPRVIPITWQIMENRAQIIYQYRYLKYMDIKWWSWRSMLVSWKKCFILSIQLTKWYNIFVINYIKCNFVTSSLSHRYRSMRLTSKSKENSETKLSMCASREKNMKNESIGREAIKANRWCRRAGRNASCVYAGSHDPAACCECHNKDTWISGSGRIRSAGAVSDSSLRCNRYRTLDTRDYVDRFHVGRVLVVVSL